MTIEIELDLNPVEVEAVTAYEAGQRTTLQRMLEGAARAFVDRAMADFSSGLNVKLKAFWSNPETTPAKKLALIRALENAEKV